VPNEHPFTQNYPYSSYFPFTHSSHQINSHHFLLRYNQFPPSAVAPANFVFLAGVVAVMAPKSKQAEGEENLFLLPPIDLDQIPLADKYRLIADTKCDFDFTDLQSWLKEFFLDQSDEIRLWESNLPLYLFLQIHHFPEFTPQ
jgi:hypothetical protein